MFGPWGIFGAFVARNVTDYYDKRLSGTRQSALSIAYAPSIRAVANHIILKLQKMKRAVVGLHLRFEDDWPHDGLDTLLDKRLNQYGAKIDLILKVCNCQSNVILYIASGPISLKYANRVNQWLDQKGIDRYNKSDFVTNELLYSVPYEGQAGVDAEVLFTLDHFIGNPYSTLSWVVAEKRLYMGRPSMYFRDYGYWGCYPVYAPPTDRFRYGTPDRRLEEEEDKVIPIQEMIGERKKEMEVVQAIYRE